MNERIEELEKQAWDYVDQTWLWYNPDNPSRTTLFKTKFAELIVKECCNAADMASDAGCEYVGDYVGEYMGYGYGSVGVATWRGNDERTN
jgi:hypothetical protein